MIRTVIIEDEKIIAEELAKLLAACREDIKVEAHLLSISDAIAHFNNSPEPDLIFADVQLPDGLSFAIFNQVNLNCPLVFITAYDRYIVNAMEHNSIDYLLKPVDLHDLERVLNKYQSLKQHFVAPEKFIQSFSMKKKTILIVKKGLEHIALRLDDIVLMYSENKIVYTIDKFGRKFICEKNLSELCQELDGNMFFRANRQYIINAGYIRGFKAYEKVKLQVDLLLPEIKHHIIISQEMAVQFRKWINEL